MTRSTILVPAIPAILLAALATPTLAQVRIDTPRAGWRSGSGEGADYTQEVSYPASNVNSSEHQSDSSRIRGAIEQAAPKPPEGDADTEGSSSGAPALLVVNGSAMPLKVDDDGRFDRPYAFDAGSNSVEIRDAQRMSTRRVQFHNAGSGEVPARLRVLLAWDSDGTDLDLHVITPDGEHAWYGGRVLKNGGALDVDVTTGYGPEIFSSPTPLPGQYLVYVNFYGGNSEQELTVASITTIGQEGTANEKRETRLVPMRAAGELTLVASFSYP
jgi:uncharacterized protein YfaP (DUF2135 family)